MNLKKLKTKHIVALALTLFMVVPMLFAAVPMANSPSRRPSYHQHCANRRKRCSWRQHYLSSSAGSRPPLLSRCPNRWILNLNIGGTNNGISGASYIVNWNPAVLTFESYTDGAYLPDQSNAGDLSGNTASGQLTIGQIAFNTGNAMATADNAAGSVSATIVFQVASAGTSAISLSPQTVSHTLLLLKQSEDSHRATQ